MTQLDPEPERAQSSARRIGVMATVVGGSFVGGAAIGVIVLALVMALFAMITFGWGLVLFSGQGVKILMLGGLAGGVTGVIVSLLATVARRFIADRHSPYC